MAKLSYYLKPGKKFLLLEKSGIINEITVLNIMHNTVCFKESVLNSLWYDTEHQPVKMFENAYKEGRIYPYHKILKERDRTFTLKSNTEF